MYEYPDGWPVGAIEAIEHGEYRIEKLQAELAEVKADRDAMVALHEDAIRLLRAHSAVAESFVETVERAERSVTQKGGQHVPYHGDFASAREVTRRELMEWAERFREASK